MKKILITGGAGFIGSHTADALLKKGYEVRVLDVLDPQIHGEKQVPPVYLDERVELMIGDIRYREDVAKAIEGIDAIYHFAAKTGVGQSMYEIHSYCDVNVNGTAMLLDVLANTRNGVKKIILSSSRAVYGEGQYECTACGVVFPPPRTKEQLMAQKWEISCPTCGTDLKSMPTVETKPPAPISVYALTKRIQEDLIQTFSVTYGTPFVILRYFNVYGTRQAINNPYTGIGAIFTNRVLSGNDIIIYEDGKPGRDFVNVRDVVQANLLALENNMAENDVFNVGTGKTLSVFDLATLINQKLKSNNELQFTKQFRVGDVRDCYADITKSVTILGYHPTVSFEDGVEELISWACGEQVIDCYIQAEKELIKRGLA